MKLTKHVDFDSLLSGVAPIEKIAQALDDGHQAELNNIRTTMDKTASDSKKDDAVDAMAAGAAAGGAVAYHQKGQTDKALRKLKKHDDGKLLNRVGNALGRGAKTVKKTGKKIGNTLTLRDKKRERLVSSILKGQKNVSRAGKAGLGLAAGAAGLKVFNDRKGAQEKTASTENIRGQLANEVERESTPEGGALHRGQQGATIGGMAGFMHGVTKKSAIKGSKARLLRGAWHGTAGAVWGGGAAGGATYAKKKAVPDSNEDKQKAYEKKLEKRAFDNIGRVGDLNIAGTMYGDKEANIATLGKAVAGVAKKKNNLSGAMDFTTPAVKSVKKSTGTTFNPGTKSAVTIGGTRKKPSSMSQAMAGKGRADAKNVKEQAFINGDNKGTGVMGGLRRAFSGLTSPDSAVGKLGRKTVW